MLLLLLLLLVYVRTRYVFNIFLLSSSPVFEFMADDDRLDECIRAYICTSTSAHYMPVHGTLVCLFTYTYDSLVKCLTLASSSFDHHVGK